MNINETIDLYTLRDGRVHCAENIFGKEKSRFDYECDVLVCGAGTSGAFAAICAAEKGLSVICAEKNSSCGGTGTAGGVWDYFYGCRGGRFEELDKECIDSAFSGAFLSPDAESNGRAVSGFLKEYLIEKKLCDCGAKIFFRSAVCGVFSVGRKICGAQVRYGGKNINIKANTVIDSTGGAEVCRIFGCEFYDENPFLGLAKASKGMVAYRGGFARGIWSMSGYTRSGTDCVRVQDDISTIVLNGYSLAPFMRESYDESEFCLFDSAIPGIRESACVVTEETVNISDIRYGRGVKFPVFYFCEPLDGAYEPLTASRDEIDLRIIAHSHIAFIIGISAGMLVPKNTDGLLVACRSFAGGHGIAGGMRMKRDMQKLGEAAAVLAELYINNGEKTFLQLIHDEKQMEKARRALAASGCYEDLSEYPCAVLTCGNMQDYEKRPFIHDKANLLNGLAREKCGVEFYSEAVLHNFSNDELYEYCVLSDKNRLLSLRCALLLGLRGDARAKDRLFKELESKIIVPSECIGSEWKYYVPDLSKAALVLARLGDTRILDFAEKALDGNFETLSEGLPFVPGYENKENYRRHFKTVFVRCLAELYAEPRGDCRNGGLKANYKISECPDILDIKNEAARILGRYRTVIYSEKADWCEADEILKYIDFMLSE